MVARGIEATELTVGWQSKPIAQIANLLLQPASILAVAGPNGVGKSTLIKTLARQIAPLGGTVRLDGIDISTMQPQDFARLVAYVPQSIELLQDMTVQELVQLGRNPHQKWWSWQTSEIDEKAVTDAMERTGTLDLRGKFLGELSGGERQRTSLAMALAQNAGYILLDEPTAHLDFKHQLELVDLLQTLKSQGIGILVILHDLNLMSRVADQILFLKQGTSNLSVPAAYGSASDVLTQDVLQNVYEVQVSVFTDPESGQRNFVPARVVPRSAHISGDVT